MVKTLLAPGLELKNPVMSASGTFGYGKEFAGFFDLSLMGAVTCKTVFSKKRDGNKPPRIADFRYGMLNSIGLPGEGIEYFQKTALPFLEKFDTKVFASVAGGTAAEYAALAKVLDGDKRVHAIELNLSCPNVEHGCGKGLFSQSAADSAQIVAAARAATKKPIFAKLSAMVTDITQIARACEEAGADGLTLINTLPAMLVDLSTRKPALGNVTGGLSGGAIKPVALKAVWDCYRAVKIPILGSGGIMDAKDALEFILCGASAVQAGSVNFVNPFACKDIAEGMEEFFKAQKITDISQLKGQLKI